jgi:hypothetical protein
MESGRRDAEKIRQQLRTVDSLLRWIWVGVGMALMVLLALGSHGCSWTEYKGVTHKTFLQRTRFSIAPKPGSDATTVTVESDSDHAVDKGAEAMSAAPDWVKKTVQDAVAKQGGAK